MEHINDFQEHNLSSIRYTATNEHCCLFQMFPRLTDKPQCADTLAGVLRVLMAPSMSLDSKYSFHVKICANLLHVRTLIALMVLPESVIGYTLTR